MIHSWGGEDGSSKILERIQTPFVEKTDSDGNHWRHIGEVTQVSKAAEQYRLILRRQKTV